MKNIRHLMVASKGHGTTTNSAAQQQNIRYNHQYYALPPKLPYDRTRKPRLTFSPALSLSPCPLPSLTVPHTLPSSLIN